MVTFIDGVPCPIVAEPKPKLIIDAPFFPPFNRCVEKCVGRKRAAQIAIIQKINFVKTKTPGRVAPKLLVKFSAIRFDAVFQRECHVMIIGSLLGVVASNKIVCMQYIPIFKMSAERFSVVGVNLRFERISCKAIAALKNTKKQKCYYRKSLMNSTFIEMLPCKNRN